MDSLLPLHTPASPTGEQEPPQPGPSRSPIVGTEPDGNMRLLHEGKDPLLGDFRDALSNARPIQKRSLSPVSESELAHSDNKAPSTISKKHKACTGKATVQKTQNSELKKQARDKVRRENITDLLNELKNTLNQTDTTMSEREVLEHCIAFVKHSRNPTTEPTQSRETKTSQSTFQMVKRSDPCQKRNVAEQQRRQVLIVLTKELEELFFPNTQKHVSKKRILQACLDYIRRQKGAPVPSAIEEESTMAIIKEESTMAIIEESTMTMQQVNELADMLAIPEGPGRTNETIQQCKLMIIEQQSLTTRMRTAKEMLEQQDQQNSDTLLLAIANEGRNLTNLSGTMDESQIKREECDASLCTTLSQLQTIHHTLNTQLTSLVALHGGGKATQQTKNLLAEQETALANLAAALAQKTELAKDHIEQEKQKAVLTAEIDRLQGKLAAII